MDSPGKGDKHQFIQEVMQQQELHIVSLNIFNYSRRSNISRNKYTKAKIKK
jgi:hypothetical protein